ENLKIHADIDMIKTIIRNFMSNAIKFSEKDSSIEIYVAREGDFAKISVQDHGRGISDENQNKLFKVESNYTTYGTANEEGSGLGLLLCKDFAIKNGGDLLLESKEGEGSIFSLLVPIYKE
nr:ATP-binding protein [Prevotella sp.]